MIELNLLPDVKLEYIKARRAKRLVMISSFITTAVALGLLILLFVGVTVLQKRHITNLDKDIAGKTTQLRAIPELNKILTIQNQLKSLPALHDQKPVASRLFSYLTQVTPVEANISNLSVDFTNSSINITGEATNLTVINKFTDTLKFTTYKTADATKEGKAFSNVVLTSFGRSDKGATYQISINFDPVIFSSANEIALTVPQTISTRSETEKPAALFQQSSPMIENNNQNNR